MVKSHHRRRCKKEHHRSGDQRDAAKGEEESRTMEKKGKKAKWLSGEALQIAVKKERQKQRRKGKI